GRRRSHIVDHRFGSAAFGRPGRAALGSAVFGFASQRRRAVSDRRRAARDGLGGGEFVGNALLNIRVRFRGLRGRGGFRRLVGLLLHLFLRRQGGLSQCESDRKQKCERQTDCFLHTFSS